MAKITIELDTETSLTDLQILRAVADAFNERGDVDFAAEAYRAVDEAEAALPSATHTEAAETAPPKRTRRTKAEMEAAKSPAPQPEVFASPPAVVDAVKSALFSATEQPSSDALPTDAPELSVAGVNAKIHKLLDAKVPALQLQEALLEATDGKYRSANAAANANDMAALGLIDKAIDALTAAL